MRLKKLEISGFKSFFDKSTITFPAGISAVVGPNGCGKSNIIDALKWVMGEQSVKQLRGKSMEDVIFSGTNGKMPLNMAEVSLTLKNDNGSAPEELKDFTEISLTRRLYRSGESAYYINKQPCRLKDIHNVFMGSGLGSRSFAVIKQGNIGAITDASPEERRFIIEEAAGVTRFKSRKNEALRKIESTKQNLFRVEDILTEIKRQMAGLKRQARKAELYRNHQKRIKTLDVRLSLHKYDNYSRQIEETGALLKELKDKDISHTSTLNKLDTAVEEIKLNLAQKNQEISDQKTRKFEIQRNVDKVENELDHLRKEIERLTLEIRELQKTQEGLETKNKNILSEVSQGETQNTTLNDQMEKVQSNLDKEKTTLQQRKDQFAESNRELDTCKTNLMELIAQEARFKNIYQNTASNKENLKKRLKRVDEEKNTAEMKTAEMMKNQTHSTELFESFKKEVTDLKTSIDTIQKELGEKNKSLSEQVKLVQTLDLERNKARYKFTTLKKMEDNFEWYKDGVKAIMKRGGDPADLNNLTTDNGNGILGLIADIIEPKPSYEEAVEAVLGETLQYIIVKDQEVSIDSIGYLQSNNAGRSGFVPVSSVKRIENGASNEPDPSKKLLNNVLIKPGFEKVADSLLGHVIVAGDLKEAKHIFNQNGILQTIVTKEGDIISHQGIMIGGSKGNLSGILAKKQEIKDLKQEIVNFDNKIVSGRRAQSDLESVVRAIESNMQKMIEQLNKAKQNETEAEKALYKASEDLKHARRHLDVVTLEKQQLISEETDIDEKMAAYNKELAKIEGEVKTNQEKINEITKKTGNLSSKMEYYNQKVVDLNLNKTSLSARLENSNNSLRRLKEFQNDGINQLEQIGRDISQKEHKIKSSTQQIVEYEQSLSVMYENLKRIEQALETNEADYAVMNEKLKDNDIVIYDIQDKKEKVLEKLRLLELDQSQRNIQRENIENRIKERYQSSLFELKTEVSTITENLELSVDEMEIELEKYRNKIANADDINLGAINEYEQLRERYDFLIEQRDDLQKAIEDLHKVIKKINKITQTRFMDTFNSVNEKINEVFPKLFEGGTAKLVLTEPDN
ncbi:MAG: chromosome segregation protein SMC, partial [Desulfobacterales bacterium]|nr:chromosome segregation protein SMC [Desulfobacterales bacterium]